MTKTTQGHALDWSLYADGEWRTFRYARHYTATEAQRAQRVPLGLTQRERQHRLRVAAARSFVAGARRWARISAGRPYTVTVESRHHDDGNAVDVRLVKVPK